MKKIIIGSIKTAHLDSITNDDYVGIQWIGGERGWIMELAENRYVSLRVGYESVATCWERSSKKAYVSNALDQDNEVEAFVFNDWGELARWLKAE